MAIKPCGLSVMEPKRFSEPHTTFTGYDRSPEERQIENSGRGVTGCVGRERSYGAVH